MIHKTKSEKCGKLYGNPVIRENSDRRKEDRTKEDRMREDRMREDRTREDRMREDRMKEDRMKEDRTREDRTREDRTREDRMKEDRISRAGSVDERRQSLKQKERKSRDAASESINKNSSLRRKPNTNEQLLKEIETLSDDSEQNVLESSAAPKIVRVPSDIAVSILFSSFVAIFSKFLTIFLFSENDSVPESMFPSHSTCCYVI